MWHIDQSLVFHRSPCSSHGDLWNAIRPPAFFTSHSPFSLTQATPPLLLLLCAASSDRTLSVDKWLSRLDSSGWLGHVKDVLTAACVVSQCMDKEGGGESCDGGVVCHGPCFDGRPGVADR